MKRGAFARTLDEEGGTLDIPKLHYEFPIRGRGAANPSVTSYVLVKKTQNITSPGCYIWALEMAPRGVIFGQAPSY